MQIITDTNNSKDIINRVISKHGCAAEHNYYCYIYGIEPWEKPYSMIFDDDIGILAKYDTSDNDYYVFTEILAPVDKKVEVLRKFLDNVFSQEKKPRKVWVELETPTRKLVVKSLKNSNYKCNKINYTLVWPVFEMDEWNGDLMQGGEWKDMRYYWNKFFKEHKVEFVTADKVSKDELKQLVHNWKKNRTTGDRAYIDYYIHAIDTGFAGYDVNRIMVVDGKAAAISAGFKPREGYYYSSIGLYDKNIDRSNEVSNMDDLINLKKLGYKIVDFGGVENKSLEFKKKFRPTRFYKTHIFSIQLK